MEATEFKLSLQIAGFIIQLVFLKKESFPLHNNLKNQIVKHYKGFIVEPKKQRLSYRIIFKALDDINIFHKNSKGFLHFYEKISNKNIITYYHISFNQFQIILKEILAQLIHTKGFIIHASAIKANNKAVMFLGDSGAGKSTVVNILRKTYQVLADDIVIIKKENNNFYLYQTPFIEKAIWIQKTNNKFNIERIFLLNKSPISRVEDINNENNKFQKIYKQFWANEKHIKEHISLLFQFISKHPQFNELYFSKNKTQLIRLMKSML